MSGLILPVSLAASLFLPLVQIPLPISSMISHFWPSVLPRAERGGLRTHDRCVCTQAQVYMLVPHACVCKPSPHVNATLQVHGLMCGAHCICSTQLPDGDWPWPRGSCATQSQLGEAEGSAGAPNGKATCHPLHCRPSQSIPGRAGGVGGPRCSQRVEEWGQGRKDLSYWYQGFYRCHLLLSPHRLVVGMISPLCRQGVGMW